MGLIALICVIFALFIFALAIQTPLSDARLFFTRLFWMPCVALIADIYGFRFAFSLRVIVILLSLVFGTAGLILLARSKQNEAPMITLFILTDVAFLPSVYYSFSSYFF